VEKVSAVRSVGPAATTQRVNLEAAAGPALRGPREIEAPAGPSVGPRQVTRVGDTIGVGTVERQGDGSSVREGIASNRDVLGSAAGPRLANVNTNVGEGMMEGSGGTGQGGVSFADCFQRPEVQEYWSSIERRMYARWVLPADVSSNQEVRLRFQLDAAGSARTVELIPGGDARLGKSAMDALRSAAPFPPMSDRVRCLAGAPIVGTFRNPLASGVN
jgi:TonB family protein